MGRKKCFNDFVSFAIDADFKKKATIVLEAEGGKTISSFCREALFEKVRKYEEKNGPVQPHQLTIAP